MAIRVIPCTQDDAAVLARMNRMLIEDEQADNPMTIPQLEERMTAFLRSGYEAFLFEADGKNVGYALVDGTKTPPYLRHFFIGRECRRMGYGKAAFHALLEQLGTREIDIDVFVWNARGLAFWKSLGFAERCLMMRFRG